MNAATAAARPRREARSEAATAASAPTVLVHITTVPETLEFLAGQVAAMKARGFEVHVVSAPGEALDEFARRSGVTAHPVAMRRRITPLRDLATTIRLWRLLRRLRPEVVHAHTPKGGLLGMIAAWAARVPVRFYSLLGLPLLTANGPRGHILGWTERTSFLLSHRVLCISHSLREIVLERRIGRARKIGVLRRGSAFGVDAHGRFHPGTVGPRARQAERTRLGIADDALVVGFVGRLVREKGLAELIAAWEILREDFPRLHLVVAGSPEPHDPLPEAVARRMDRDPRIHLAGHVAEPAPLYAAMDLLALPTYREGFGQVSLEAAAMGLPVVATRVPGCVDAIRDGVTGLLVPPRDPVELAAAIRRYLLDPALRIDHGRAGRERVLRDFRPEDLAVATFEEYARLLRSEGLPVPGEAGPRDPDRPTPAIGRPL